MKNIEMYCDAGLCNRLRVLDACILLSGELDRDLVVQWPVNQYFGTKFDNLFHSIDQVSFQYKPNKDFCHIRGEKFLEKLGLIVILKDDLKAKFHMPQSLNRNRDFIDKLKRFRRIKVATVHRFLYPEDYGWLKPKLHIDQIVSDLTSNFNEHTIGIHVRRGDHVAAIKNSPTNEFIKQMEIRLIENSSANFYLATDDEEVRLRLKKVFKGLIHSHDYKLTRGSKDGDESSAIDLICLSKASEIWGSRGSSFSETAYHIGKGKLKFI